MVECRMAPKETSGHTRRLRDVLTAERKARGWSTQRVADEIAADLSLSKMSGETVRLWETLASQPPIDRFAAWARVLGFRLIVDLDRSDAQRRPVLVRTDEAAEVARLVDDMSRSERRQLLAYLNARSAPEADE